MNRIQQTICHATNGALTGAILYLTFVPQPNPHHTDVELMEQHR